MTKAKLFLIVTPWLLLACGNPKNVSPFGPTAFRATAATDSAAPAAPEARKIYPEVPVDTHLFSYWENEVRGKTSAEVDALNEATLAGLEAPLADAQARPLSEQDAQQLHRKLEDNIVTSNREKYERPGVAIGYCFGRAMFVHLLALKNHYRKAQIRKLWVVGPMDAGGLNWAFHVTTIVRDGAAGDWRVIDSYLSRPTTPRAWLQVFRRQNSAGNLRLYVTRPEKFAPDLGKYTREELGLDLSPETDWYRHYFTDLLGTLKLRRTFEAAPTEPSDETPTDPAPTTEPASAAQPVDEAPAPAELSPQYEGLSAPWPLPWGH